MRPAAACGAGVATVEVRDHVRIDQQLGRGFLGTLEVIYGNDLNNVIVRNADLVTPVGTLPDGRPYFGGAGANELNPDGGAGIYVLDNTNEGYNLNITAQLRKTFSPALSASLSYSYNHAKNNLKSTEIASVLWQSQPIQGNPNNPELGLSEFGQRHRIVGTLFGTGSSMASHIAATFGESSPESRTALMAIGVALFLVTMVINILARLIVRHMGQSKGDAAV